jgi:hypothetical protein
MVSCAISVLFKPEAFPLLQAQRQRIHTIERIFRFVFIIGCYYIELLWIT